MNEDEGGIYLNPEHSFLIVNLFLISSIALVLFIFISVIRRLAFNEIYSTKFLFISGIIALIFFAIFLNVGGILYWLLG